MAIQHAHDTAWNEARRLSGKNFTCVLCSQRFVEDDLRYQDDLKSLPVCPYCFEPNGGELARTLARAEGAELAARLTAKEAQPPKEPGWFDGSLATVISSFSERPLVLTRSGPQQALTLTGIFNSSDTFTYSEPEITDAVSVAITDEDSDGVYDQAVLTVEAGATATLGLSSLTHVSADLDYGTVYRGVFEVRA